MMAIKTVRSVLAFAAMITVAACAGKGAGSHASGSGAPQSPTDENVNAANTSSQRFAVKTAYENGSRSASRSAGLDVVLMSIRTATFSDKNNLQSFAFENESGATQLLVSFVRGNFADGAVTSVASVTPAIMGTASAERDASGVITAIHAKLNNTVMITWSLSTLLIPEANDPVATAPQANQGQNQGQNQKQDIPKQDLPKQDIPKQDVPKQDIPKQDLPKQDLPKQDLPKQDVPKQDVPKQDVPKQDVPKQDVPKQDVPKQDVPKQDVPKQDVPKQDVPKQDVPKQDVPKQDVPKQDMPKFEKGKRS